eukprot:m.121030 g.121030  ORF g.121030 m.121030 type:complete len:434 (+) comp13699_c1_seq7:141-1442(+)
MPSFWLRVGCIYLSHLLLISLPFPCLAFILLCFLLYSYDPHPLCFLPLSVSSSVLSFSSRVSFMLEAIGDLMGNRSRVLKDNKAQLEPLVKAIRSVLRTHDIPKGEPLEVPLQDLLNSSKTGRWWLVGAAWAGRTKPVQQVESDPGHPSRKSRSEPPAVIEVAGTEVDLVQLASQQRMNTEVRKKVFSIVMSAEDYSDAMDKLFTLGLRGKQTRELIRVPVECCVQEQTFNPYYAVLVHKLCEHDNNHRYTLQFAIWDRLKELEDLSTVAATSNLMRFIAFEIAYNSLSLAALKVIEFESLPGERVFAFQILFSTLLTHYPEEMVSAAFERLARNQTVAGVKDSILLFLKHYVAKFTTTVPEKGRHCTNTQHTAHAPQTHTLLDTLNGIRFLRIRTLRYETQTSCSLPTLLRQLFSVPVVACAYRETFAFFVC